VAGELDVVAARSVAIRLVPGRFAHQAAHQDAISADFARRRADNPTLFNGRFFVMVRYRLEDGAFAGECVETDYASYLHWRGTGFPGDPAWNAFAMAAVHAPCGRLLMGRMAAWTANAGTWYPPAGSLDASDLASDGSFDLDGNIRRELGEEIGLSLPPTALADDWRLVFTRGRLAMFRRIALDRPAAAITAAAEAHLAADAQPELDALAFVDGPAALDGLRTTDFVRAYVAHAFGPA